MVRADRFLVDSGFFESRNRASEALRAKKVIIDGVVAKPSTKCNSLSKIEILEDRFYISRSAQKLEYFLKEIDLNLKDKIALDIGSSTGGFVQILLENFVKEVVAVDVGDNQLHKILREDNRVRVFENCDIREFKSDESFDIVTCDVSFISILKIIDSINRLSKRDIIILFKPQFEVGRDVKRSKRGVVIDNMAIFKARLNFEESAKKLGWRLQKSSKSKLSGKSGNIEYLYHFIKV
jgi:23S rRNA (cytidine1920-2'-O)/16S rRNA (cytidine1409-2'-O)-methyltransferase